MNVPMKKFGSLDKVTDRVGGLLVVGLGLLKCARCVVGEILIWR